MSFMYRVPFSERSLCREDVGGVMAGEGNHRDVLDFGISRARFLKLAGLGAGLSLFPGSLFPAGPGLAVGRPKILTDARYPIAAWWPPPPVPSTGTKEETLEHERVVRGARGRGLQHRSRGTVLGGNGVSNDRANKLALEACATNDLRLVLADQALRNAIDGTAVARAAERARRRRSRRASCRPSPSRTLPRTCRRRRPEVGTRSDGG